MVGAVELDRDFAYSSRPRTPCRALSIWPMLVAAALAAIKPDTARGKVFRLTESGFYTTRSMTLRKLQRGLPSFPPHLLGYFAMLDSTPPV